MERGNIRLATQRELVTPQSLADELTRYDLIVVEDLDSSALNARYLAHRPGGLRMRSKAGRLCRAEVSLARQ